MYVLTAPPIGSLSSLSLPIPWDKTVLKLGQLITVQVAFKCSREKKCLTSFTFNQTLDVIERSEEGMSKAKMGQKLGLFCQTLSQVVNAKEKFWKEIKSATSASTWVIRKCNSLVADMETVLVV